MKPLLTFKNVRNIFLKQFSLCATFITKTKLVLFYEQFSLSASFENQN